VSGAMMDGVPGIYNSALQGETGGREGGHRLRRESGVQHIEVHSKRVKDSTDLRLYTSTKGPKPK
jgi:hypothetical protein